MASFFFRRFWIKVKTSWLNADLVPEFADELGVVVVRLDDLGLAAGQVGGALDEVGPQGALGQEHFLGLQVHLPNHLVGHLGEKKKGI